MQKKPKKSGGLGGSGIVVSDTTYNEAKYCKNIIWEQLNSINVKGFTRDFKIFRPYYQNIKGDVKMKKNRYFIGFEEQLKVISKVLIKNANNEIKQKGKIITIEGDHWNGGTHFARQLLHEIQHNLYCVGTVNLAYNNERLNTWKGILTRIVRECRILRGNEDKFILSFKRFMHNTGGEHLIKYLPVLNELLDCKFEKITLYERQNNNNINYNEVLELLDLKSKEVPALVDDNPKQIFRMHSNLDEILETIKKHPRKANLKDIITKETKIVEDKKNKILNKRIEIIKHLLKHVSLYTPLVIIIAKHQYMDVDSWDLLYYICQDIYNGKLLDVNIVLSGWSMNTRSMTYWVSKDELEIPVKYHKLREKFVDTHVVLSKWPKHEVRKFLHNEFDVQYVNKDVLKYIMHKTDGIPGMVKSLIHDPNYLFLSHGGILECSMIERCGDLEHGYRYSDINIPVPYPISSYYTKMLDSLEQFALLTLKTASVISVGQEYLSVSFAYDVLESVHPLKHEAYRDENKYKRHLHRALDRLEKEQFIVCYNQNPNNGSNNYNNNGNKKKKKRKKHDQNTFYIFTSGFMRDVTYSNMLFKQRSQIHKNCKILLMEGIHAEIKEFVKFIKLIGVRHIETLNSEKEIKKFNLLLDRVLYNIEFVLKCGPLKWQDNLELLNKKKRKKQMHKTNMKLLKSNENYDPMNLIKQEMNNNRLSAKEIKKRDNKLKELSNDWQYIQSLMSPSEITQKKSQEKNLEMVRQSVRRHELLAVQDGMQHESVFLDWQRQKILGLDKLKKQREREDIHNFEWTFHKSVLVIYILDVHEIPPEIKSKMFITLHIGDDKGAKIGESLTINREYLVVNIDDQLLRQLDQQSSKINNINLLDDADKNNINLMLNNGVNRKRKAKYLLSFRLWIKEKSIRIKQETIGKFSLDLKMLYEKQLSTDMVLNQKLQRQIMNLGSSNADDKLNKNATNVIDDDLKLNNNNSNNKNNNKLGINGHSRHSQHRSSLLGSQYNIQEIINKQKKHELNELFNKNHENFIYYKMKIPMKQKRIDKFKVKSNNIFLETAMRFVYVDMESKLAMSQSQIAMNMLKANE